MFRINAERTYKYPVAITLYDESGAELSGKFSATFRALHQSEMAGAEDERLLDRVLIAVEGVEIPAADGSPLQGTALLDALKDDLAVAAAISAAYMESMQKKPKGRK